jgi:hypothetical protein
VLSIDWLALVAPSQARISWVLVAVLPSKYGPTVLASSSWAIVASSVAPTGNGTTPVPGAVDTPTMA